MIKSNLVGLRAVEEMDLAQMRDWRNIEHFRRNFREFRELNLVHQKKWFDKIVNSANDFMFVIQQLAAQKPVGICGLTYVNWVIRSADFSFYIGDNEVYIDNQGISFEAANLLLNYGFNVLNLNKVWMELFEFDHEKIGFFTETMGFTIDGKLRDNCFDRGKYHDSLMLSLLRSEWTTEV